MTSTGVINIDQWMAELMGDPALAEKLMLEDSDGLIGDLLQGFPGFASAILGREKDPLEDLNQLIASLGMDSEAVEEEGVVDRLLRQQSVTTLLGSLADELGVIQGLVEEISTRDFTPDEILHVRQIESHLGYLMLSVMDLKQDVKRDRELDRRSRSKRITWIDRLQAILFYKLF
jgi:hypothetical protein